MKRISWLQLYKVSQCEDFLTSKIDQSDYCIITVIFEEKPKDLRKSSNRDLHETEGWIQSHVCLALNEIFLHFTYLCT